jgi:hypothetical protein
MACRDHEDVVLGHFVPDTGSAFRFQEMRLDIRVNRQENSKEAHNYRGFR